MFRGSGWVRAEEKSLLPVVFGHGPRGKEPLTPVHSSGGLCCSWRVQNSFSHASMAQECIKSKNQCVNNEVLSLVQVNTARVY